MLTPGKQMLSFIRSKKLDKQIEQRRERLYRLAVSWCHDDMLADDLVQDCISKALQKHHQLKDFNRLDAWLFRILHNNWMEYLRKYKPTTDLDDIDSPEEYSPESMLSEEQLVLRVQQAVSLLPISQRQVITLVDLEGCSYLEVTEILDIPIGTVMSRLCRARASLKKKLIAIKKQTGITQYQQQQHPILRRVK